MRKNFIVSALVAAAMFVGGAATSNANLVALWTFETSVPTTAGPFAAEAGVNAATSFASTTTPGGASVGVISNPAGNVSVESFSSTGWDVGDYFQFTTSSTGYSGLTFTFDATGSNTGPRDFKVQTSVDGVTYLDLAAGAYTVLLNGGTPNPTWGTTTGSAAYTFSFTLPATLANLPAIGVRLVDTSTTSINGATVASGGTSRVDNVQFLAAIPEVSAFWCVGICGVIGLWSLRKRRQLEAGLV